MKHVFKSLLVLLLAMVAHTSHAVTLFPYFVDVAGDYKEGSPAELKDCGVMGMYYAQPSFYRNIDEARSFYDETMPFSTETIQIKELPENDVFKGIVYISPMQDDVTSLIYLIETADKTFYICYLEQKM